MSDIVTAYTGRVRHVIDCAHCGERIERYVFPGQEVRYCSPRCGRRARGKGQRQRQKDAARWALSERQRERTEEVNAWVDALRAQLGAPTTHRSRERCHSTGKVMFASAERAWVVAFHDYRQETLNADACTKCGASHLGNLPAKSARRERARAQAAFEAASLLV